MSPILQCYPQIQSAIVAQAGVYSEKSKDERLFFTRVTAEDLPEDYGQKKERKRSRNYKSVMYENQIIAAISGDECTSYKVAKKIGRDANTVKKIINALCERGALKRRDSGLKSGTSMVYFYSKGLVAWQDNKIVTVYEAIPPEGISAHALVSKTKKSKQTVKKELAQLLADGKIYQYEVMASNKAMISYYKKVAK